MKFKKLFFFNNVILFFSFFFLLNFYNNLSFSFNFFCFDKFLSKMDFLFCIDSISLFFLFMVSMVVSLVSVYSEFYLESYNNMKFFYLKVLFFLSMIFLLSAGGYINLMMGWDWLGISSIFLIMFYPNKITLYNSYLTMMFNRLGDMILIIVFSYLMVNFHSFYFLLDSSLMFVVLLLVICSFTKSAQFPLSAWLPAAMSAPTPISAMVHSSTLVTAGILLILKISSYFYSLNLLFFFIFFSILSFFSGGLMSKVEVDFKKVVAFSTMSQISMIMVFIFFGFMYLGLTHMLFHALFKTLLFCCCGTIFLYNFSDQLFLKMNSHSSSVLNWLMFLSVFSMTGLTFSSSFYSKDKILELLLFSTYSIFFLVMIVGSILTLLYCCKIMSISKFSPMVFVLSKKMTFFYFLVFGIFSSMFGVLSFFLFPLYNFPVCNSKEITFFLFLFFLVITLELNSKMKNFLKFMTLDIFLMKSIIFSFLGKSMKNMNLISFSDSYMFKPIIFSFNLGLKDKSQLSNSVNFSFYLILFFYFYLF